MTELYEIYNKISKLEDRFDDIETKINKLLEKFQILDELEPQCKKMTEHIDFVEGVYDKVKQPMHFIFDKISKLKNITNGKNIENENKNRILDK
jgi:hypothetical protein